VIDVAADTLVDCDPDSAGIQPIVMNLMNPYTELRYDRCRNELYVGCLGAWGVMDGGVEVIDPESLESKGVLICEADLGGDLSDAVLVPGGGYAVVLEAVPWPDNLARLVRFDDLTATVTDTLFQQTSGSGSSLAGIEMNRQQELYLCDRDLTQPGIRIFDIETDTEIGFVDVGVPPFDVAFIQTPFASVDETDVLPGHSLSIRTYPNPFSDFTTITLSAVAEDVGPADLGIFDVRGRRVRTLATMPAAGTCYRARWDATDDSGRPVAPGVYFCKPNALQHTTPEKILLLR
jgi:hypothetical protein